MGGAFALGAVGTAAIWGFGRALGEHIPRWQKAAWAPTEAAVVVACLLTLSAWAVAPRKRRAAHRAALGATVALAAWLMLGEWRVWRWLDQGARDPAALRIVYWNATNGHTVDVTDKVAPLGAGLVIIANGRYGEDYASVVRQPVSYVDYYPFDVVSEWPVRRWGATLLGLGGERAEDPGRAMYLELDAGQGRAPLVVWVVDMPSDLSLDRRSMFAQAAHHLAEWSGEEWAYDEIGRRVRREVSAPGFPTPDIVLGDFNTPRRSGALSPLLRSGGTMRDAFGATGVGPQGTFPREWPLWAIDGAFVSGSHKPTAATTQDFGAGSHRGIMVDVRLGAGD